MGPVLGTLQDDGAEEEKHQLDMMMENLKTKLSDFEKAIMLQRGDNVSSTEIGGGRSVQRSTTMRVVHKTGASEGIKSAVGDFFSAAQGGKKAKASALQGAQNLISSAIDGLLGTGSGSSNECSEFVVVFMNYSFVRVDYRAYFYNVEGKGVLKSGQRGGFCSIMDVSIIPHEQIRNEEITYLLSQALHMDPEAANFERDLNVLMKLELLLAEERLVTRKMNDENTTLDDLRRMKDAMVENKKGKMEAVESLPNADYLSSEDLVRRIRAYDEAHETLKPDFDGKPHFHDACEVYAGAMVAYFKDQDSTKPALDKAKEEALAKAKAILSV